LLITGFEKHTVKIHYWIKKVELEIKPLSIQDLQIAKDTMYPAFAGISEHYLGHPGAVPPWMRIPLKPVTVTA
jgi:hypothetical protein